MSETMINRQWSEYQASFPAGLKIEAELTERESFGRVFRALDDRNNSHQAMSRIVRVLTTPEADHDWRPQLSVRADQLLRLQLPYVSILRQIEASDKSVVLVHDEHPLSLATIASDLKAKPNAVWQIAEQVITGLAALHRHGIAHGDIRPENIFVSCKPKGDCFDGTAWIVDTAIGGLTFWSKGALISGQQARYFPPEWNGTPQEPTEKADLYALGLMIRDLVRGTQSHGTMSKHDVHHSLGAWDQDRNLKQLLPLLLAPGDDRPQNAGAVLRRLSTRKRRNRKWWKCVTILCAIVALVACMAAFWSKQERIHVEHERTRLQVENDRLKLLVMKKPETPPTPPTPTDSRPTEAPSVTERFRSEWQKALAGQFSRPDEQILLLNKAFETLKDDDDVKRLFKARWDTCQRHLDEMRGWLPDAERPSGETKLARYLAEAIANGWDPNAFHQATSELTNLRVAAEHWDAWARDTTRKFEQLDVSINGQDAPIREILSRWRAAIADRKSWRLRLNHGSMPAGWGTYRQISVKGTTWSDSLNHDWDNEILHDYSQKRLDLREIPFDWQPSEPIIVEVLSGRLALRLGWRPTLIYDDTTTGPLAIWWLHSHGKSMQSGGVIEYDIVDCPGPPRDWR